MLASKNTLLLSMVAEKLAATTYPNGNDYWVVAHKYLSDEFYYGITSGGISPPVISHAGSRHPQSGNTYPQSIGQMKISPDGTKLALVYSNISPAVNELFDFNNTTGTVSNAISLSSTGGYGSDYGVSFSPDSRKLYMTTGAARQLYQYDLSSGNAATILASKTLVFEALDELINGLQFDQ